MCNVTKGINCIDCIEGMKVLIQQGEKVDGVITSPPYNIIRPNSSDRGYDVYNDGMTNEEYSQWILEIFNCFDKILKDGGIVVWNMSYGSENTECMNLTIADILRNTPFTLLDIIVWKKKSATPNNVSPIKLTRICEFIYVFGRRKDVDIVKGNKEKIGERDDTNQAIYENIFNFITAKNNDESCPLNKATYSTELVSKIIDIYFKKGSVIIDPFGGTGTTAVACHRSGIECYSFEISKAQCDWAKERYEAETSQINIFEFL